MKRKIAIVGAGISGLSVAWQLDKKKYDIIILSKAFSPDITSDKAAAFWFPYHVRNDSRGIEWAKTSYDFFRSLAAVEGAGISMVPIIKAIPPGTIDEEHWVDFIPEGIVSKILPSALPNGYSEGYSAVVPLMETQVFLPWLQEQLNSKGVQFKQKEITDLKSISDEYDAVINCSGLGSKNLCNDETIFPVRGQVVLLEPGYPEHIFLDNHLPCYIVPRKDATIIGGTYEENISEAVTVETTLETVLQKAFSVDEKLRTRKVIGSWAGLRPFRNKVRLEREEGGNIIHNYGHGGSGFTLSFGCAAEVARLVEKYLIV
ncbi:MAG: D-amino-acid:oxygen oxidoreductase [Chitinophagaceae bacterium]|nr:D-amino-acid:oxygen oxidoreductase [Chitinophagaceae bacterium]